MDAPSRSGASPSVNARSSGRTSRWCPGGPGGGSGYQTAGWSAYARFQESWSDVVPDLCNPAWTMTCTRAA